MIRGSLCEMPDSNPGPRSLVSYKWATTSPYQQSLSYQQGSQHFLTVFWEISIFYVNSVSRLCNFNDWRCTLHTKCPALCWKKQYTTVRVLIFKNYIYMYLLLRKKITVIKLIMYFSITQYDAFFEFFIQYLQPWEMYCFPVQINIIYFSKIFYRMCS